MAVKHTHELIYCSFCGKNQEEVKKNYRREQCLHL